MRFWQPAKLESNFADPCGILDTAIVLLVKSNNFFYCLFKGQVVGIANFFLDGLRIQIQGCTTWRLSSYYCAALPDSDLGFRVESDLDQLPI